MSHQVTVTNPVTEKQTTLSLENTIKSAIHRRHSESLPFYHRDAEKDTVARHLGVDYPKLEKLRRSPEWKSEVEEAVQELGLPNDEATHKNLGVMSAERKSRDGVTRNQGISKTAESEIGQAVVELVRAITEPLAVEGSYLSKDYVLNLINGGHFEYTGGELPPLPVKKEDPKKERKSKTKQLEDQVAQLEAKLAELQGDSNESSDQSEESGQKEGTQSMFG